MYFDDFPIGFTHVTESRIVTLEDITTFAGEWDPQPFHLDADAAQESIYGGIIASGFHTLLIGFKLWYEAGLWAEASMGSPGLSDLKWLVPVRPGDRLHVRATVIDSQPSKSRPDRGRIWVRSEIFNQKGDVVAEYTGVNILKRKS